MKTRYVLLVGALMACGCQKGKKEFSMYQDGNQYVLALAPTEGEFRQYVNYTTFDDGSIDYSDLSEFSNREYDSITVCVIRFPTEESPAGQQFGFVLHMQPDSVITAVTNERTGSSDRSLTPGLWLEFFPLSYHKMYELKLISFSTAYPGGELKVAVDQLDARPGGRAVGRIEYARLTSSYFDVETQTDAEGDRVFEVYNFPFDVTLGQWVE